MTYQEQYQSRLNEINEAMQKCLNEAMQKCLKEKPPCTETVQGKETEEKSNDNLRKNKVYEY